MSKTRDTGYLANVIQVHDTGVRIMSGSEMLMAISSSGAVTITGELSGSDAANSLLLNGTGSVGFTTTGSFSTASGSASSRLTQIESVYATTGSNSFRATQSITGSLTVTGQIIAQTINVQQVTSSIIYSSGSNVFGCDINSRQTFTGSFYQTGSVASFSNQICASKVHFYSDFNEKIKLTSNLNSANYQNSITFNNDSVELANITSGKDSNNCSLGLKFVTNGSEKMRITCLGSIGVGTCNPYSILELATASPKLTLTPSNYAGSYRTYLGTRSGAEGVLQFGNNNPNYIVGGNTSAGGSLHFYVNATSDFITGTNGTLAMVMSSGANIGVGASSPIAKLHVCSAYGNTNTSAIFANSNGSINCINYDTVIVQADDVTTFKIVERNIGSVDQVLTFSVGDSTARVSTTCALPLQFFVGGSPSACGYNGLSGRNALSIACSGITTFNYPVNIGSIGHYTNYISTSGCFAIFCASQGAILYVTSMHNNGRATYQLIYSNGPTGGASISVVGSTSAYGPASTSFGLCANGWVYGYQQYGGPTDFYAIAMNSNFVWAF